MNYYNENDPNAAAWLRELIKEGLIPNGEVDERDIRDVAASDLRGFVQHHFFAGIGGWSLALRLAGWPEDRPVVTGSCPCQPFSAAGRRLGTEDERHLWPAFRWIIAQLRPASVFGEQVASKDGRAWLAGVRADLEAMGYVVGAADLCAAGVGAPHKRRRLWWVAYAENTDRGGGIGAAKGARQDEQRGRRPAGGGIVGVAESNGRNAGTEREQRSGEQRQQPQDGGNCEVGGGVGHSDGDERTVHIRERGQVEADRTTRGDGSVGGGVGDTAGLRLARERGGGTEETVGIAKSSCWDDFDIVWCDERPAGRGFVPRRVEPGTFPLADGIPGRVGLLRGYGNAIVPQVAAEFVMAAEACNG